MILYSGLISNEYNLEKEIFLFNYPYNFYRHEWYSMAIEEQRVSCIYTGDTDLNKVNIKSIFRNFWKNVGTIQIPHHGDLKSFDKNILNDRYYLCPISVGENNTYGHPSYKLIANILSHKSCPILVTENSTSGFIEYIKY
jgi:beta-lactamase superfamily II metal-dependent hydrolase